MNKINNSKAYDSMLNVERWSKRRCKIKDLYPSEKIFFLNKLKYCNTFLDFGCATGNFVKIISKKTKIKKYLGLDISKNMIQKAQMLHPKYGFKVFNGEKIYDGKKYDLVYSFGSLFYCENYKNLVYQMLKSCKKFLIFDIRFSLDTEILDIKKSFQEIPYSGNMILPYNIINFFDFLKFLTKITKKKFSIECYGYKGNPSKTVKTQVKELYMISFLIDKTKNFSLRTNICEKK